MKTKKFRQSIHSEQNVALRQYWIDQRKKLGLSQRDLANKLGVTHSLIGKIETGDRRLDMLEVMDYCAALELDPHGLIEFLVHSQ